MYEPLRPNRSRTLIGWPLPRQPGSVAEQGGPGFRATRSVDAVRGSDRVVAEDGLRGSRTSKLVEDEICRLYVEDGLSTGQIASRVGLSRQTIVNVLVRNDVPRDLTRLGLAVVTGEARKAIASLGGKAVPAHKRMFAQDKELAVRGGRRNRPKPTL